MLSKEFSFSFYQKVFLILAIFISLGSLFEGVKYLLRKDAVDLGYRVTGGRLLADQKSPYLYIWKEGDDLKYYNQYEIYQKKVNGVTVPPSVLILTRTFSFLDLSVIKWIWTFLSYAMMLGSVFLFYSLAEIENKKFVLACTLFFFLGSISWLLHVERGQFYVVYLFFISLLFYFYKKEKTVIALGILCLLTWLRFPFVIFAIPFISSFKEIKNILAVIVFAICLFGISFLFSNLQNWKDYSFALSEWSSAQIEQSYFFSDRLSGASSAADTGAIKDEKDYMINNSSIQYLLQYHFKAGLLKNELFTLFVFAAGMFLYSIRKAVRRGKSEILFIASFVLYILFELFIPAPRYNYNFIQWMFPLSILLIYYKEIRIKPYAWMMLVLGLLMNMGLLIFIPRSMSIGEFVILTAVWMILVSNRKKVKKEIEQL